MNGHALTGKTAFITGGTGGIGKHTAIGLAKLGARVIVGGRDRARGEAALRDIKAASGNGDVDLVLGDLSSLTGVRKLAQDVIARTERLDILVNNAGLLEDKKRLTADGLEAHFAVNVVAPHLLTLQLLPLLRSSKPARVVNVTGGLPVGGIDPSNLQAEKGFTGLLTYSNAKRAMSAASLEMARRLEGSGVHVIVVYPGSAATSMTGAMTPAMLPAPMRLFWPAFRFLMREDGGKGAARAARSSILAASSTEFTGQTGLYLATNGKRAKPGKDILDSVTQRAVWNALERVTGATLPDTSNQGSLTRPALT